MHTRTLWAFGVVASLAVTGAFAQAPAQGAAPKPFQAGEPLSATNEAGKKMPMSSNVKVYGSFHFSESCTFDPARNMILAMNAANPQNLVQNDGFVSLINPDGSVNTSKWIGATRDGLTLNHPLGSAISGNTLYAADIDTVRTFDLKTGQPGRAYQIPGASVLNGIGVTKEGVIYVSNTRDPEVVYKVTPDGQISDFVKGAPLALPNGVAIDPKGNVVVVNIMNNSVLTFNPQGQLINTEHAAEAGNDGLVVTEDGTKYVSSVRFGSVSKIRPGKPAEVIATGIPSAASMCYDSRQKQLVIPLNPNNALAFIKLRR
ncbi:MAG TPA: gluconolaconase [Gammaproteobacteria bacterium]|nr:gluconolaconase [Gammaproteobacteria bacterium]